MQLMLTEAAQKFKPAGMPACVYAVHTCVGQNQSHAVHQAHKVQA